MKRAAALALACALLLAGCRPATGVEIRVAPTPTSAPVSEYDRAAAGDLLVLNPSSLRFHRPGCTWAEKIDPERRVDWTGSREELIAVGYQPCHYCKP